ncbi:MAG: hypothetical protein ACMUIA_12645, partial [bacterium]
MAFNRNQFEGLIKRVLDDLGLCSQSAVNLLLGTAAQESGFGTYLRQISGPALGVFQMEPATEEDIWRNYLRYQERLRNSVVQCTFISFPTPGALVWNLAYSISMARIKYYRSPDPLPSPDDIEGLAAYWKYV